jgi:hypothetical protein
VIGKLNSLIAKRNSGARPRAVCAPEQAERRGTAGV